MSTVSVGRVGSSSTMRIAFSSPLDAGFVAPTREPTPGIGTQPSLCPSHRTARHGECEAILFTHRSTWLRLCGPLCQTRPVGCGESNVHGLRRGNGRADAFNRDDQHIP